MNNSSTQDSLKELLQKALGKTLDEAKVPYKVHLAVIKELRSAMDAHKSEMDAHQKTIQGFDATTEEHKRAIQSYESTIKHVQSLAKGETGKDGAMGMSGKNAKEVDVNSLVRQITGQIMSSIKIPKDGAKGEPGKDAEFNEETVISKVIDKIKKKRALNTSDINGLQGFSMDGIKYKISELMHGGGSGGSVIIPTGTVNGSNTIFTVPPGTIITSVVVDGLERYEGFGYTYSDPTITIDPLAPPVEYIRVNTGTIVTATSSGGGSSGGSGYQAPLSGGLTGTNTWTTAPNVLVIDGVPRQKVQTDGTIMWTGSTTTVLTNAPLPTFDIFSSA